MKTYTKTLTIAGSDSGGGAGIQADLKTFSALGCYGMSAITAITAQNTLGVSGIHPIPPNIVHAQIDAIFSDMGADAVKIGMLFSAEIAEAVSKSLHNYKPRYIVLDPVMVATSGDLLLKPDAVSVIIESLFSISSLITPNLHEAAFLCGFPVRTLEDMHAAAYGISTLGAAAVLLKGGHLEGEKALDLLYIKEGNSYIEIETDMIETAHTHGTGCTLSSAITAFLAKGHTLEESVRKAKSYLTLSIREGSFYQLGKGRGPVHHFSEIWD